MSLNMKKEIRKELRTLRQQSRLIDQKLAEAIREDKAEIKRLEKLIFKKQKSLLRANLIAARGWERIEKREAILQGRLS